MFFKKKKQETESSLADEFYKYFNAGEEVNAGEEGDPLLAEQNYQKAYEIARKWVLVEHTSRSLEALGGSAYRLGTERFDMAKLKEAETAYEFLAKETGEELYKNVLADIREFQSIVNDTGEKLRKIMQKYEEGDHLDL